MVLILNVTCRRSTGTREMMHTTSGVEMIESVNMPINECEQENIVSSRITLSHKCCCMLSLWRELPRYRTLLSVQ